MGLNIRFAGTGGQGIIFSGVVLARAAALHERKDGRELFAIQTQSYGPEARGGASKCDVVISEHESFFPFVEETDYLVSMSQPAYDHYVLSTKATSKVIVDQEGVKEHAESDHVIPAVRTAKEMGMPIVANTVMLGALVHIGGFITEGAVRKALAEVSPPKAREINDLAFQMGLELGRRSVG
jgi:2-oxoglutarate ferredoxin oxidoreductase subunit gamma